MQRRQLLASAALSPLALSMAASSRAATCELVPDLPPTLVNVMLYGGLDTRFVFMPTPEHDAHYLDALWRARRSLYSSAYASYADMFAAEYLTSVDPRSGAAFGIHRRCGWLRNEFAAGRVAIVANVFGSTNRRHDQAALNVSAGAPDFDMFNPDRDGWGGRLVTTIGGNARSVELGSTLDTFSKGSDVDDRLLRVVHAHDTRHMALPYPDESRPTRSRNVLARAMRSYYTARGDEIVASKSKKWAFRRFFDHFESFEALGRDVTSRLATCGSLPSAFDEAQIDSRAWRQQCKNLHDLCLLHDILGARCVSMNYGGFDTHSNQASLLGTRMHDLFGAGGGLATTLAEIDKLPSVDISARDNLVFYFATDFGRQLLANGTRGTDHGMGLYSIFLGSAVRGGLYGEMFPSDEAQADKDGRVPMLTEGADIIGRTSAEQLVALACDWVEQGTGAKVVPAVEDAAIESPRMLDGLLRA